MMIECHNRLVFFYWMGIKDRIRVLNHLEELARFSIDPTSFQLPYRMDSSVRYVWYSRIKEEKRLRCNILFHRRMQSLELS